MIGQFIHYVKNNDINLSRVKQRLKNIEDELFYFANRNREIERLKEGILELNKEYEQDRKPMKRKLKPIFTGLLSLLALIILEGCHMENKSEVATKESQITFLKVHEKEMTEYIKSQNNKIESIQYDWDSVEVGTIGNGLPQGGEKVMTMSGKFNELQNSSFMLSFGITKEQMPIMKEIGIMQPFRVLKNGVDEIYE